ncbi:hypothetical protein M2323_004037 [Rhodoblastus acidophilus]|uniref:hypothetical protein n=1 Tax=Rhodoblastus acidophilus TaxID=1074 RepID=UPI00222561A1|nr:hypothetical protein [Rhodoblastus acidophilus]MCW2286224.1 hypothetical protein [Rhodoblastus acidophilus]MCW2335093.1 hypothetical protein [Rhodoblastus acidophilus]
MKRLDPKLVKVIALWRGTEHEGERQSARARIETLAAQVGMTVEEAISQDEAERNAGTADGVNVLHGFDDFMEAREPGYKARRARERSEKIAARVARRKVLLERFDSEEAITAPCERERLILDAVKPWRTVRKPPYERWTDALDGWSDAWSNPPAHIDAAIRCAYPLPMTFAEALAEHDYWEARGLELADAWNTDRSGEELDLAACWRARTVERLIEFELVAKDAADVLARFRFYRARECHDRKAETAIFNDLERIVMEAAANVSSEDTCAQTSVSAAGSIPATVQRGQIEAAIAADPSRSDRSVARELGCSPTTVGKVRASMGLGAVARSVQRGGQMFAARYGQSTPKEALNG